MVGRSVKDALKAIANALAMIVVVPQVVSFRLRSKMLGADRALEGSTQALSLIPGIAGQFLRRAFLSRALAGGCATSATIEFGTIFSRAGSRIDENVYVGPRCHLGLVHLERDVLIAAAVHIPSGPHTHGTDPSMPIREQPGQRRMVRIGAGSWIGSNAVVLAEVGRNSIVAAGAVVTHPIADGVIAAGVPARVVRHREPVLAAAE
jgi:acetyltransferase-like isoleucine patch superfamily enzyme